MLAGYSPFVGDNYGDMMKISQSILKGEFTFPETFPDEQDSNARDLITRLLKPETERLGCLHRGMQDVREHVFFRPLLGACESKDWARLDRKELVAPWIPTISHAEDMSNFEDYEDDDIDHDEIILGNVVSREAKLDLNLAQKLVDVGREENVDLMFANQS